MKPQFQALGDGIHCIETHYHRDGIASCYLLQQGDCAALIDTGTARTTDNILQLVQQLGLQRDQIKYVIPTHVHLDHAGGAGQLMAEFPQAMLVVHPFGARHMIDPTRVAAATREVYGASEFARNFVALLPIDEQRVIEASDDLRLGLNGRELRLIDTPGHARHHLCVWDQQSRGWFTGDTFGIAYPELQTPAGPFMFLPSTPVQFDPVAWHKTLDRLISFDPQQMYLTHYGAVQQPAALVDALHREIDDYVEIADASGPAEGRRQRIEAALWDYYLQRLQLLDSRLSEAQIRSILDMDMELCAQGLDVWLQRRDR